MLEIGTEVAAARRITRIQYPNAIFYRLEAKIAIGIDRGKNTSQSDT